MNPWSEDRIIIKGIKTNPIDINKCGFFTGHHTIDMEWLEQADHFYSILFSGANNKPQKRVMDLTTLIKSIHFEKFLHKESIQVIRFF